MYEQLKNHCIELMRLHNYYGAFKRDEELLIMAQNIAKMEIGLLKSVVDHFGEEREKGRDVPPDIKEIREIAVRIYKETAQLRPKPRPRSQNIDTTKYLIFGSKYQQYARFGVKDLKKRQEILDSMPDSFHDKNLVKI